MIGEDPTNPAADDTITGTPVLEILTNYPLGSSILTGLFVHITVTDASGNSTTYDKTLYDRIGIAARLSGNASVTVPASPQPALTISDLTTFNVLPSQQDQSITTQWNTVNASQVSQIQSIQAQLPTDPNATLTTAQTTLLEQANTIAVSALVSTQRIITSDFAYISDRTAEAIDNGAITLAYAASPRLIATSTFEIDNLANSTSTLQFGLDLVKDDLQVLPLPGNSPVTSAEAFRANRGLLEAYIESQIFSALRGAVTPSPTSTFVVPYSTFDILQAAAAQNIPLTVLTPLNNIALSSLGISAQAQARISQALGAGRLVEVPTTTPTINGVPTIGWVEFQTDGTAEGLLENGDHGAFDEYADTLIFVTSKASLKAGLTSFYAGFINGVLVSGIINILGQFLLLALGGCTKALDKSCFKFNFTSPAQYITAVITSIIFRGARKPSQYNRPVLHAGLKVRPESRGRHTFSAFHQRSAHHRLDFQRSQPTGSESRHHAWRFGTDPARHYLYCARGWRKSLANRRADSDGFRRFYNKFGTYGRYLRSCASQSADRLHAGG